MDPIVDLLKKNLLFKGCTSEDFELISGLFQERKVKPNTTIFSEKMPAEALYIVKSGKVKISVMEGEGDEIGLLELGPGDYFGEIAIMLTRRDFVALLDLDPRVGVKITLAIARLLAMRVKAYSGRLREILLS
jgi:CRP-like cAMP-binding protein